jgi:hypothetical protein
MAVSMSNEFADALEEHNFYHTKRRHIPEDSHLHENLKSHNRKKNVSVFPACSTKS